MVVYDFLKTGSNWMFRKQQEHIMNLKSFNIVFQICSTYPMEITHPHYMKIWVGIKNIKQFVLEWNFSRLHYQIKIVILLIHNKENFNIKCNSNGIFHDRNLQEKNSHFMEQSNREIDKWREGAPYLFWKEHAMYKMDFKRALNRC